MQRTVTEEVTLMLTAFKQSGKYYTHYDITCRAKKLYPEKDENYTLYMPDVVDAIRENMINGKLPAEFTYYVTHDHGYPCLVHP